jgi:hypothetical protein
MTGLLPEFDSSYRLYTLFVQQGNRCPTDLPPRRAMLE